MRRNQLAQGIDISNATFTRGNCLILALPSAVTFRASAGSPVELIQAMSYPAPSRTDRQFDNSPASAIRISVTAIALRLYV